MTRVALASCLALAVMGAWLEPARAQDEIPNFSKPVLMSETDGHHASVRSLIWPDQNTLLSAGMDKVAKVWDLSGDPRLSRTIRPPIWRGPAGIIYAAALSPWPDLKGTRLLAVAGFGVESRRGDITVFAYPGPAGREVGEPVARLLTPRTPEAMGHRNSVFTLAFDPKTLRMASAGLDGTIVLWNMDTFQPMQVLRGPKRGVRAIAFFPDGKRLASVSEDGVFRIWDIARGVEAGAYLHASILNTLAIAPDGLSVVVGTEKGEILAFDPADLRNVRTLPTRAEQGPVEHLAFRPDGKQIVASVMTSKADMPVADYRNIACDVEIRNMPGGEVIWSRRVPGLVYAAAFRPDNLALAYAGGLDQAIVVQPLANLNGPATTIRGQGTAVLDVGFTADSRVVGFTRDFAPGSLVEGFNLADRQVARPSRDALNRAITTLNGWSLSGSINRYELSVVNADGRRWPVDLDRNRERLWWSYTFIPPGPGHPRPTIAIGCETGVVVYDLETGRRTRFYAGHGSPVISLASSPDGRWLAEGSIDQTITIDALDGCDQRPKFGITLAPLADGTVSVGAVAPKSFAKAMGLLPGDVLRQAKMLNGSVQTSYPDTAGFDAFVAAADEMGPYQGEIALWARRTWRLGPLAGLTLDLPPMPSTKRDNTAMTLMLDRDHEWVLWTPQGYYDTSIEGDTRLLGWHVNAPYNQALPNDYLPLSTYQNTLYRPAVLRDLWRTGELAIGPPPPLVEEQPPRVAITALEPAGNPPLPGMPWVVNTPEIRVRVDVTAQGPAPARDWEARLDQQRLVRRDIPAPGASATEELRVPLPVGRPVRLSVEASNTKGNPRVEILDVVYAPVAQPVRPPDPKPAEKPRNPRTVVLAIGAEKFPSASLPEISFADADARDLGAFLGSHLIPAAPPGAVKSREEKLDVLSGAAATTEEIRAAFDRISSQLRDKQLLPGDAVSVLIEAHAIETADGLMIALSDAAGESPAPVIPARELSERLGELAADYGCRVSLFLDMIHPAPEAQANAKGPAVTGLSDGFKRWLRDLQQERQVIVFVASKEGPSRRDQAAAHGIFALGVLGAFEQIGANSGVANRASVYSLNQFKAAIAEGVQARSGRRQDAGCYVPRVLRLSTPFASPVAP